MKKIIFCLILVLVTAFNPIYAKDKIQIIDKDSGVYIFRIDTNKYGDKIKPFITPKLTTPKKVYDDNCFDFVVNAGFFDVRNGKTVSYITIDNKLVGDVKAHEELIKSLKKEDRLDKVLSRGELRILQKNKKLKFDIARHDAPIQKGYTLKHAIQAGPILYPDMNLTQEGFVIYDDEKNVKFQSVDILKRRERTAIGLKGKWLYIVLFTNNFKVDANEMRDYMQNKLKLKKVLAFDGGLSTSVNYKNISVGSLGKYQRKVKSFLIIER